MEGEVAETSPATGTTDGEATATAPAVGAPCAVPHHPVLLNDPTLHLNPRMRIGWYICTQGDNVTDRRVRGAVP